MLKRNSISFLIVSLFVPLLFVDLISHHCIDYAVG